MTLLNPADLPKEVKTCQQILSIVLIVCWQVRCNTYPKNSVRSCTQILTSYVNLVVIPLLLFIDDVATPTIAERYSAKIFRIFRGIKHMLFSSSQRKKTATKYPWATKWIVWTCAIILAELALSTLYPTKLYANEAVTKHSATVILKTGAGYIERAHRIVQLQLNSPVEAQPRDVIVTNTGIVEITYFNGHTSTLMPHSKIEIVFHQQNDDEERVVLLQRAGRSINNVGKVTTKNSRFEVQTASSIAAVGESEFAVELSTVQRTIYSSNTGAVKVFMDDQEPVQVQAGYEAAAEKGKKASVAPMHNTRRTALFTKKTSGPSCNNPLVHLKQPSPEQMQGTVIDFYGTAMHKTFAYYKIEYTMVGRPANKYSWLYRGDEPVEDGLLASVDVSNLAAGEYVIRLQVVDKTGNYPEPCLIDIEIK